MGSAEGSLAGSAEGSLAGSVVRSTVRSAEGCMGGCAARSIEGSAVGCAARSVVGSAVSPCPGASAAASAAWSQTRPETTEPLPRPSPGQGSARSGVARRVHPVQRPAWAAATVPPAAWRTAAPRRCDGSRGRRAAACGRLRPPRAGAPSARSRDSRETRGLGSAPPRPRGALLARLQQGRPDMAEGRVSGGPRGKARGGAGAAGRPTGPCGSRPGVVARGAAGLRGGPFQPVGARRAGVLSAAPEATPGACLTVSQDWGELGGTLNTRKL